MKHLTPEELSAHLDGTLAGAALARAERHLAGCEACRAALADLSTRDDALRPLLEHDPGEAYFETFAARVEDRIRAAGLRGAQARLGGEGAFGWLRSPRRLAWVGAVATVIAGAAIVIVTARLERPELGRDLAGRAEQGAGPARQVPGAPPAPSAEDLRATIPEAGPKVAARKDRDLALEPETDDQTIAAREARSLEKKGEVTAAGEGAGARTQATPKVEPRSPAASRLIEVRGNAGGEDVPVKPTELQFAAPPPAGPAANKEGEAQVVKPQMAAPAQGQEEMTSLAPGAADAMKAADQEVQLCGRVLDPAGRPVAGAQVALADRGRTAATDANGRFCLAAPPGTHSLSVMAVGYRESRLQVRVGGEAAEARVTLKPVSVLDQGFRGLAGVLREKNKKAAYGYTDEVRSPFAALPDSIREVVWEAERLSEQAGTRSWDTGPELDAAGAGKLDAAAAQWERVLARLHGGAPEAEARYRLAEARYRAWTAEPTPGRAAAAAAAIAAYLERAPAGARRAQAMRWQTRVKR